MDHAENLARQVEQQRIEYASEHQKLVESLERIDEQFEEVNKAIDNMAAGNESNASDSTNIAGKIAGVQEFTIQ